jgi:hypothetical protein
MKNFVFGYFIALMVATTAGAAVIDNEAWVEGKIQNIKGEIVYFKNSDGKLVKLRRNWVEKSDKEFKPGQTVKVQVDFEDFIKLNSE